MSDHPLRSRADVVTASPARYAKQLVAHLGHKLAFSIDGPTATAAIAAATAQITVGDGVLTLLATSSDEQSLARVEDVLGRHLERFGERQGLTVTWARTADIAADTPAEHADRPEEPA